MIQHIVVAIKEQYITAMKIRETGNFTGDTRQMFTFLVDTNSATLKNKSQICINTQ